MHCFTTSLLFLAGVSALVLFSSCSDPGTTVEAVDAGTNDTESQDTTDEAEAMLVPLIAFDAWEVVTDETEDPFSDLRPEEVECDQEGLQIEQLTTEWVFSIETSVCNYVTLRQPLLAPIEVGDRIDGRLWHFDLTSPVPDVSAYTAFQMDGALVWEKRVRIPTTSGLVQPQWVATQDVEQGTAIYFHLNNHGANSWSLIDLVILPDE